MNTEALTPLRENSSKNIGDIELIRAQNSSTSEKSIDEESASPNKGYKAKNSIFSNEHISKK